MTGTARYLLYFPAALLSVVTVYPLVWNVLGGFKSPTQAANFSGSLIPTPPTLSNYRTVLEATPFLHYVWNTLAYSGSVTVIALLVAAAAGYALARLEFPGRHIIFLGILGTMMIPFSVIMIPLFLIVKSFGWVNSLWGLIIPALFGGFSTFLCRQFFMSMPRELEDAAKLDGASIMGIFVRIALPLARPILYALSVFIFLANWNSYLWPLILLQTRNTWVISLGIAAFSTDHNTEWNLVMAATTLALVPTLILFALFQRRLVEGIKLTGGK